MSLASGTRLGPYEIVSPLRAGGMGEVYRAKDTRLERSVPSRLHVYETHIRAILSYYCRATVMRVDAECEAELVTRKMLAAVSILKK